VVLSVVLKRPSPWMGAAAAFAAAALVAAGCTSRPGGLGLHAAAAQSVVSARRTPPQNGAFSASSRSGVLEAISCPRPASCVAVGFRLGRGPGHIHPLAEAWNGRIWRALKAPPLPGNFFGELDDVSCASATRCLAVGTATTRRTSTGIAEAWNGGGWQRLRVRFPGRTVSSGLAGVSCRRRSCMIVGSYQRALPGQPLPLAMQLRGTRLRLLRPRLPRGRRSAELAGVSCASASACMAVGDFIYPHGHNGPPGLAMAETWDGTRWRVIDVPTPDRAPDSDLAHISCATAARCMATGGFNFLTAVSERPLTELWKAGRWRVLRVTGPRIRGFFPLGVSCGSAKNCIAVGSASLAHPRPGAERWNGRRLRALPVPAPASGDLNGVSCNAPTRCIAAGDTRDSTLAELWNGTRWQVLPAPGS
jgi:hypothetical protein